MVKALPADKKIVALGKYDSSLFSYTMLLCFAEEVHIFLAGNFVPEEVSL